MAAHISKDDAFASRHAGVGRKKPFSILYYFKTFAGDLPADFLPDFPGDLAASPFLAYPLSFNLVKDRSEIWI
jgi:hypothetical protein